MQHSRAKRGADGQFAPIDGPKAKPIHIWLQPDVLERLDRYCRLYKVGRGKAIGHLLQGALPPEEWMDDQLPAVQQVSAPEPTAPAAGNGPTDSDQPVRPEPTWVWGLSPTDPPLPRDHNRAKWWECHVELSPDESSALEVERHNDDGKLVSGKRAHADAFALGRGWIEQGRGGVLRPIYRFLLHSETGEVFTGGMEVPEVAITAARKSFCTPPTDSGRQAEEPAKRPFSEKVRELEEYNRKRFQPMIEEAKALGIKFELLSAFKSRHRIPIDQRLSAEALDLFHQEQETTARAEKGNQIAADQHRSAVKEAATAERLQAIKAAVEPIEPCDSSGYTIVSNRLPGDQRRGRTFYVKDAARYLLDALPTVGIRKRQKLVKGVWDDLAALGVPTPPEGWTPLQRALYWGAVLRLPNLEGEPPTDSYRFLDWCQFGVTADHRQRVADGEIHLGDLFAGRMGVNDARQALDLPLGVELTRDTIRAAYRKKAAEHHPDRGGDANKYQRATAARDRLLLEVAG